jgi:cell division protein FtsA
MQGTLELAEQIFKMPVRLGVPFQVLGSEEVIGNPAYSAGIGLLMFGAAARNVAIPEPSRNVGMFHRMKGWLQGNF